MVSACRSIVSRRPSADSNEFSFNVSLCWDSEQNKCQSVHRNAAVEAKQPALLENQVRTSDSQRGHPDLSTIPDLGEQDGQAFIAMECLDGTNLPASLFHSPTL
jgi:hypothetical protein